VRQHPRGMADWVGVDVSQRTCVTCEDLFTPRGAGRPQRYCGARCRELADNARKRTKTLKPGTSFTCAWCSTEVPYAGKGRPPKFCSNSCRQRHDYAGNPDRKRRSNQLMAERYPGYYADRQQASRDRDPEGAREACRRYYAKNAHNWDQYRQARSKYVRPEDAAYTTWAKVAARFAMWGGKCWLCGVEATARDHVKPLSKGGRHLPSNIRPICGSCNSRKGSRWPFPVR
jgi:5-methylcytosine-specific restriction endonuclease McrA